MTGLTDQGFQKKTRIEIENSMKARAKNLFGNDINLSDKSPLGKIIKNTAFELSESWNASEDIYSSRFVDFASGVQLDYLCKLIGISRRTANPARSSEKQVFEGDDGTTIPSGYIVETEDEIRFLTTDSDTIENGTAEVHIEAEEPGSEGNLPANTITGIVNPISGLESTYNPAETIDGRDIESDFELRNRFQESLAAGGGSTIDAIRAELLQIDGVIDAIVEHNNTMNSVYDILDNLEAEIQAEELNNALELVDDTRDAIADSKSINAIIYGGQDEDISNVLFDNVAAGIQTIGDTEIMVDDDRGIDHPVFFDRPDYVDVYVNAQITTGSNFPTDGHEKVRTEIIKYIGGVDEDQEQYDGLTLGDDVIRTRIIAATHNVDGIVDVDVLIGETESDLSANNISINDSQVSRTDYEKVEVT